MKKIIAALCSILIIASAFSGCAATPKTADHGQVKVVSTIFPLYDWVREVAGDDVDVNLDLLLDNGVDLHSYQPTAKDIMDISDCDIFVYVGGESDKWVADTLKQADNKNMIVLDLMDILGDAAKEEELKEGMQGGKEEEAEEEPEYDEHVWLSLKNAKLFTEKIADALSKADSQHADVFKTNAENYTEKLEALDKQYQETVDNAPTKTLLFGDRYGNAR